VAHQWGGDTLPGPPQHASCFQNRKGARRFSDGEFVSCLPTMLRFRRPSAKLPWRLSTVWSCGGRPNNILRRLWRVPRSTSLICPRIIRNIRRCNTNLRRRIGRAALSKRRICKLDWFAPKYQRHLMGDAQPCPSWLRNSRHSTSAIESGRLL